MSDIDRLLEGIEERIAKDQQIIHESEELLKELGEAREGVESQLKDLGGRFPIELAIGGIVAAITIPSIAKVIVSRRQK